MASCDDDFGLLGDDAQRHHHHHPSENQQQPPPPHRGHHQPENQHQQTAASPPFVTHRYVTASSKGTGVPLHQHHHHNHHLHHRRQQQQQHAIHHHHHPQHQHPIGAGIPSPRSGLAGEEEDDGDGPPDDEHYGDAFGQPEAPKLSAASATTFHDVCCFADATSSPFVAPSQAPTCEDNIHITGGDNSIINSDPGCKGGAPITALSDTKRRERDDLSDDGASPYSFVPTTGHSSLSGSKKPKPSSCAAAPSSSGDYRKDREEWSDSAIGCLLDAYTEKYIQLNRGNLRGRDWEEVATIVSERCDKQKSCKSVEQCKNKVDNLKKRYKAERQRISTGSLSASHWPWFKKMEQIVGSSTPSTNAFPKPVADDDKSAAAPALANNAGASIRQAKRFTGTVTGPVGLTSNLKMKTLSNPRWRRVVLKLSGSAFAGNGPQNVDPKITALIAREIDMANRLGIQVAIVVGGRNFFCGDTWVAATGADRTTAYQIGMMASAMNSVLLQASLERIGVQTRVQTAFMMQEIAEQYVRRRAIKHLEKGRVVIFGGVGAGTGHPLFSMDTAAALRASEICAEAVLKGTIMDTAYDCHSRSSVAFEHMSYRDSLSRGFSGMDMTAITFCEENNIPVVVFNLLEPGNISRALCGDQVGVLIDQSGGG